MNNDLLSELWHQISALRLLLTIVCGMLVGIVYFGSLRWSLEYMVQVKHKIALYAGVAFLRILLFFGVLVALADHNAIIVMVYVFVFFISRAVFFVIDRKRILQTVTQEGGKND